MVDQSPKRRWFQFSLKTLLVLTTIEELKARGQTMLIVEQSLNVALAIADRAIFLEKGEVRFEGPAQELLERDDLARAVFFGTEGG